MKKFLEILIAIFYFVKAENPTESEIWLNEETKKPVNTLEFIFLQDSAGTDFVLSADISLLPNDDLRENFLKFARKENLFDATSKQAFVIPAFEIKHGLPLPRKRLYRSFVNQNHLKSP